MKRYPNLIAKQIFAIPAGDLWGVEQERVWTIYAPLNGKISLADKHSVEQLENAAAGGENEMVGTLSSFEAKGAVPVYRIPHTAHDMWQIDILANYTCNFKCVYCYSAKGRSSKQVEWDKIKALVDYLFLSGKKQTTPYIINFSGGGEPLLSFELIRRTVDYIEQVNANKKYAYNIGMVTNGSLITPQIIDYLEAHKIDMAVSFEILEQLQNKERGSYDKVAANIDMMLERGFPFGIRTTFTPDSVQYMTQMIEELHRRFPRLKKVVYDVVLAPSLFQSPAELKAYYDAFLDGYYAAKQLAATMGIKVESIAVETLSMVRERTCNGKIVLTPMGTISSCARVSSPLEQHYEDYVFGEVTDGQVIFDDARFKSILDECNIYSQPQCRDCFARWNCGGGCRLFHHSFSEEYNAVRCDFVRKALLREMIAVLANNFRQATGNDLYNHIKQQLDKGEI